MQSLFVLLRSLLGGAGEAPLPAGAALADALGLVLNSAEWRVLAPLVEARLRELDVLGRLDTDQRETLHRAAAAAIAQSLAHRWVLECLGERAERAGLGLVLLKGAALTGWIYPWCAPRLGADVDLLVRAADAARVEEALSGFAVEHDAFAGRPHLGRLAFERAFLVASPTRLHLDVHQQLVYPALYPVDYEGLWRRASPHPGSGSSALLVPSAEDMLLHLAIHCVYDMKLWSRHDVDAALLIRQVPIDWEGLVERAGQWGAGVGLYLLLSRTEQGLGCTVPTGVLARLRPGPVSLWVARRILGRALRDDKAHVPGSVRLRQLTAQWLFAQGGAAALGFQVEYALARLRDTLSRGG